MQLLNYFKTVLPGGATVHACIEGDSIAAANRLLRDDPCWNTKDALHVGFCAYDEKKYRLKVGRKLHFWTD